MATMAENVIAAVKDLVGQEKLRYDNDIKAVNILLLGFPVDIYTLINHYQTTKEIWDRIKELMEGTEMTKQECYALTVVQQPPTIQPNTGFVVPTFLLTDDPIASLNKAMIFLSSAYSLKYPPINNQLRTSSNPRTQATIQNDQVTVQNVQGANQLRVIRCYNYNGEGHISKQCTVIKRVKDSEWFKDKMLLDQAQEARVVLNDEQHDFFADSLEETNDYEDLQLQATTNFKADHVDAYDSKCDDELQQMQSSWQICLLLVPLMMTRLNHLGCIEDIVSNNVSYDELMSNSNVISYIDYMLTIRNDADNYFPPPIQKNDMMLFIIEQMKSQVEKCNMVNQETQSVNESLTSELERYKDRILEYASKDGCYEEKAFLDRESRTAICDHNRKVSDHENQIFSQQKQMENLTNQYFVPQKQLSAEQLYWSSTPSPPESVSKPTKVFPKELPSTSQVLKNLNNAQDFLSKFNECIKRRTTLSPNQIGNWEQSDIKGAFKKYVIPFSENLKETFKLLKKDSLQRLKKGKIFLNKWKTRNCYYMLVPRALSLKAGMKRRVSSTNASGTMPKSIIKNDRTPQPSSRRKKNKVEAHHRKFKSSANKNNHVSDCNAKVKNVALSKNSDTICLSCNECLFSANHDACFIVEIVLWYLDYGCSKHMTGHRDKLINFVSKFIGMVRFGNDHFAAIMGYGDLLIGNILISRVYYVERLGHNLFSVGQFCDSDLKVTFRKHTCFIRNLEGVDLLSRSRSSNLYTISMADMMKSSLICLLSKASKTNLVLRTNDEAPETIIKFLKQAQVSLNATVRYLCTDNNTEFINQTLRSYTEEVGITHNTSTTRTLQQNGIVERRNRTLVEAARTMLIFSKSSLFLWAEAVATACYTQYRSLIYTRYNKTPYELLGYRKPKVKYLHVFGALCYLTKDFEDMGISNQKHILESSSATLHLKRRTGSTTKGPDR
ncbi:integrase, catalytic region, zinc finger, CCHC-type containing protein [Tanacetum coccineum]